MPQGAVNQQRERSQHSKNIPHLSTRLKHVMSLSPHRLKQLLGHFRPTDCEFTRQQSMRMSHEYLVMLPFSPSNTSI